MAPILIVADDLSGAADCGVACAAQGVSIVVALNEKAASVEPDVIAFDANTRAMTAPQAAAETGRIVRLLARGDAQILFKKLDSTLRGHLGVEIAAALQAWRSRAHRDSAMVVAAPAFPATGRTTLGGRQWLNGVALEPDLPGMLRAEGLNTACAGLEIVRSSRLPEFFQRNAAGGSALVCDAQTESDLRAIAEAVSSLGARAMWAGSAGLARYLPLANRARGLHQAELPTPRRGPVLVVVGSLAGLSRSQAAALAATGDVVALTLDPQMLLAGHDTPQGRHRCDRFRQALGSGRDVLIVFGSEERVEAPMAHRLCDAAASIVAPHLSALGGLVLTGGETARAILTACDVQFLVPVREVEPGVVFALASTGRGDRLPVITKAGAFGDSDTLVRCRVALRNLFRQDTLGNSAMGGISYGST